MCFCNETMPIILMRVFSLLRDQFFKIINEYLKADAAVDGGGVVKNLECGDGGDGGGGGVLCDHN